MSRESDGTRGELEMFEGRSVDDLSTSPGPRLDGWERERENPSLTWCAVIPQSDQNYWCAADKNLILFNRIVWLKSTIFASLIPETNRVILELCSRKWNISLYTMVKIHVILFNVHTLLGYMKRYLNRFLTYWCEKFKLLYSLYFTCDVLLKHIYPKWATTLKNYLL